MKSLELKKIDFSEFIKFEAEMLENEKAANARFTDLETTMHKSIDYMVHYQWKETRSIVNRAITKVTRPLQIKDLFYVNVGGNQHEVF